MTFLNANCNLDPLTNMTFIHVDKGQFTWFRRAFQSGDRSCFFFVFFFTANLTKRYVESDQQQDLPTIGSDVHLNFA